MLPILRREIIESRRWMDEETVMDYYALSQGLPGIIAVNVAVFIGYYRKKVPGALAAALGWCPPASSSSPPSTTSLPASRITPMSATPWRGFRSAWWP